MNPDQFQEAWKAESVQLKITFDAEVLSNEVLRSQQGFRSVIFWRDVREAGISLALIPVWFFMGIALSLSWVWYLAVPALIWVAAFILVDRRLHPQRLSEPGEPLGYYVKESLTQVEHQIWLLRNVLWWYLLPLGVPLLAFFLHASWQRSDDGWEFALDGGFWVLFMMAFNGMIYFLNQYAVRNQLEPRRQDLLKVVSSLEDSTNVGDAGDIMELVSALDDPARKGHVSWVGWAENWNRIVPSWGVAAAIILPTLVGACGGYWFPIPDMGPVFFQSVVAAVIPFEISFGIVWLLSYRKQKRAMAVAIEIESPDSKPTLENLTELSLQRKLPKAPAVVIIVLILFISAMAFLAIYVCVSELKSESQRDRELNDVTAVDEGGAVRLVE